MRCAAILIRREIDNDGVYRGDVRPIHLADGRTVPALVYLADRAHRQFAGKLPLAKAVSAGAPGDAAPRAATSTMSGTRVAHLRELGLRDQRPRRAGAPRLF